MRYTIDLRNVRKKELHELDREHFFGFDNNGRELGFNNYYMLLDGKPFYAISGECHFSRVPENQWEETVIKMKSGGLNVIATYVFWNHHEEIEGQFRFDGRRNLRKFIELCKKHDMFVILRIGPFDHGEVRNGGLPDWLYGKPFEVRCSDEGFLNYTRTLYRQISGQIKGLLYKDGGPIIAAQIENEYMHSAAPWEMTTGISDEWITKGSEGQAYMLKLRDIAREEGIDTPFYTCTGWGGAATPSDEMIPLWGGYAFWPWMFYHCDYVHPATPEYIYRDNHNNTVPKTYNFEPTYEPESMPYACCEMGGGMLNFYNYRFQLPYESVDAMANIKMASGCNFLGYYMYRGGNNPHGEKTPYLNECQCPKISYDYQAPIGEFGQLRPSYFRLRTIHLFAKHFTDKLCDLITILPEGSQDIVPEDQDTLRYAIRTDGHKGFLFINNYQDHAVCKDKKNETITLQTDREEININDISLLAGESAILPFNMDCDGVILKYATAQPLSRITNGTDIIYIFFTPDGMKSRYVFEDGDVFEVESGSLDSFVKAVGEKKISFVTLSRADSLRYNEFELEGEIISFLSDKAAYFDGKKLLLEYTKQSEQTVEEKKCGPSRFVITIPELDSKAKDYLLCIDYRGDSGSLFDDKGNLISDNFSNESVWETGLKENDICSKDKLTLYITPRKKDVIVDVSSTMAGRSEKTDDAYAELLDMKIVNVYEEEISLNGTIKEIKETMKKYGLHLF